MQVLKLCDRAGLVRLEPVSLDGSKVKANASKHKAKRIYSRRKVIVEPVFGQIKEARRFRQFSLRGLRKVRGEWTLVALCHNLLKLLAAVPILTPA